MPSYAIWSLLSLMKQSDAFQTSLLEHKEQRKQILSQSQVCY